MNKYDVDKLFINSAYNVVIDDVEINNLDIINSEKDSKIIENKFLGKLNEILKTNDETKATIENINLNLLKDIERMDFKINKALEKLRGAILAERNTTSTIYSTIMPITEQQKNRETTNAVIIDNIVFGVSDTIIDNSNIKALSLNNIIFKNLEVSSINKSTLDLLEDFVISNKTHNSMPFEFTIDLRGILKGSSSIILNLLDYSIIEIYINGNLYKEKTLSNYFNIPVDLNTQSITIRSYPTIHKASKLRFNKIGITNLIYQNETVFETKELSINKDLTYLVLDTCDNSNESTVNIQYELSVNGKAYEKISPVNKNGKNIDINIQSIITLDKDSGINLIPIYGSKFSEGDIRYLLPSFLQNNLEHETLVYFPNNRNIVNKEFFIKVEKDFIINRLALLLNVNNKIYIDGFETVEESILLPKGIRSILVTDTNNNIVPLNYTYLQTIVGKNNIFINKQKIKIFTDFNKNKYISLSIPNLTDSYTEYSVDSVYKEVFIPSIKSEIKVDTLKIKATLKSMDMKTVPYISKILIRGT